MYMVICIYRKFILSHLLMGKSRQETKVSLYIPKWKNHYSTKIRVVYEITVNTVRKSEKFGQHSTYNTNWYVEILK